jgi:hypothetical protein
MRIGKSFLAAGALLAITIASDSTARDDSGKTELKAGEARAQLRPLFRGDTERIAPHLGLTASGCLEVQFGSKKQPIFLRFVVWHNGKAVRTQDALIADLHRPTEITFSLKEESVAPRSGLPAAELAAEGQAVYHAIVAIPGQTGSCWFKMPVLKTDLGLTCSQTAQIPTVLKEGQEFDFWGMYAGDGAGSSSGEESLEEKAKRVEWAIVLRLCPQDWQKTQMQKPEKK